LTNHTIYTKIDKSWFTKKTDKTKLEKDTSDCATGAFCLPFDKKTGGVKEIDFLCKEAPQALSASRLIRKRGAKQIDFYVRRRHRRFLPPV
jgi:hypothetical protein